MKKPLILVLIVILFIFQNCSSSDDTQNPDPGPTQIVAATDLRLIDIANSGNGSDIQITFNLSNTANITEIRLFIVKQEQANAFNLTTAQSVTSDRFTTINLINRKNRLSDVSVDIDGDLIIEGINYVAYILSVANTNFEDVLSNVSSTINLEQANAVSTLTDDIPGGSGGLDIDSEGNIYMADFSDSFSSPPGQDIFKITPQGEVSLFATGLNGGSGNDFDADGNLIQSNIAGNTVSRITPGGIITTIASGFVNPVGVTVAPNGDFFVCNCNGNSISKVTDDGATVTIFSSSSLMNCPNGIDMDSEGNLYVANFNSSNLVKITPDGQASVLANMPGNNNGHLLINGDFIYVVARGLHQIYRVTFDGNVSLFAGNGNRGIIDGTADQASFSFPNDLAFSSDGRKLYVNDVNAGDDGNILSPVVIRVIDIVE